jgi:SAM-dependent methyltransferase
MANHPYLLENVATQARDRFEALSALFDGTTFDSFERVGISAGWKCWEVGAGGPSVPNGMAQRCMPGGHVLATDIDITWTKQSDQSFEVRLHDAASEPPPAHDFDLVHARLVLQHIHHRDDALSNMIASLKSGGWLVVEDFDSELLPMACFDAQTEAEHRANRIRGGFHTLLDQRGVDRAYGSKLARLFRKAGLQDVHVDMRMAVTNPARHLLERANVAQLAKGLLAVGAATEAEINAHLAALDAGEIDIVLPGMFTALGRKL